MRSSIAVRAALGATALALVPAVAHAATPHPGVVAAKSPLPLPQLVASTPAPHVDALAVGEGITFAGGLFSTMTQGGVQRTGLGNLVAFNSTSGAISPDFNATTNGQVNDLELGVEAGKQVLYVAGDFTAVSGVTRSGLAKLDATTGAVLPTTAPAGKINDIDLVTTGTATHLFAAGPGKGLVSLNPVTLKKDTYSLPAITNKIPGSWGTGIAVYQFAVSRDGNRLAAVGDFQTVGGQPRTRFFMLDLGATGASLNSWYYQSFAKPCSSTAARRIAYLQGVDWSPDGSAITVSATGQVSKTKAEIWRPAGMTSDPGGTTVCDAVGRFSTAVGGDKQPLWINYTGGDSVWRVQDTGAAVYASGHFQWLDNADGIASNGTGDLVNNTPAVSRKGIGAINPSTGRALDWAPQAENFKQGGKGLLATSNGLWIGNDSKRFGGQPRYGLAFAPLP